MRTCGVRDPCHRCREEAVASVRRPYGALTPRGAGVGGGARNTASAPPPKSLTGESLQILHSAWERTTHGSRRRPEGLQRDRALRRGLLEQSAAVARPAQRLAGSPPGAPAG